MTGHWTMHMPKFKRSIIMKENLKKYVFLSTLWSISQKTHIQIGNQFKKIYNTVFRITSQTYCSI